MTGPQMEPLIAVPSGQPVTLIEVIHNEQGAEGLATRFRFLAPLIAQDGGSVDLDMALEDMHFLCQNYALPKVLGSVPLPVQIVISMSDVPVPFGEAAPEATQYFEAYSFEGGVCRWEIY